MLPKININNKFEYLVHHSNELIDAQGYTVGQESVLLTAIQMSDIDSKNEKKAAKAIVSIQKAITRLCQECILTEGVDVKKWPNYELEHFFLKLRLHSTGDIIKSQFQCDGDIVSEEDDISKPCRNFLALDIDLNDFEVKEYDEFSDTFPLSETHTLKLKSILPLNIDPTGGSSSIIKSCLDTLEEELDGETITHDFSKISDKEIDDFVNNSISPKVMNNILKYFFNMMPTIYHNIDVTCDSCGKTHKIETKTIASLFQ